MACRKGEAEGVKRIIFEFLGVIAVLMVLVILFVYFLNAQFDPSAINTAKAITFATSCSSLINIHPPGDVPQEIQSAWDGPASPDIEKSCSEAAGSTVKFGQVKVKCDSLDTEDGACEVRNFALPQENAGEAGKAFWKHFIAGMGDPKYLLYYEAFPHGPSNAWEPLPENTLAVTEAIIGGTANIIFLGAGRAIKAPLHKLFKMGDEVTEVAKFNRVSKMASWVRRGGSSVDQSADDLARNTVSGSVARSLNAQQLDRLGRSGSRDLVDDLITYQKNNRLIGRQGDDIAEEIDRKVLQEHLGETGMEPAARRRLADEFARMLYGADEVAEGYGIAKRFTPKQYWRQMNAVNSMADDMMEETSEGAGVRIIPSKLDEVAKSSEEGISGLKSIPKKARGFSWDDFKRKTMFIACRSKAVRMAAVQNADDVFKDNAELEAIVQGAGLSAGFSNNICSPKILGEIAVKSTWQLKFYAAVLGTAYVGEKRESISGKYKSDGINTIVLKRPFVWMLPGHERTFRLNKYANYYHMSLNRKDFLEGDRRRFYLASPLTSQNLGTDDPHLVVEHEQIQCKRIDATDTKGSYMLHTQPDWNDGERQEPPYSTPQPGSGEDSRWDNQILVRSPNDPNTELTPGEPGLKCGGQVQQDDCSALNDHANTKSICQEVPGCTPEKHIDTSTGQQDPVYWTCTGTPASCDTYKSQSKEDVCRALPNCNFNGYGNPDVPTVISSEANGIKECMDPGFVDEFTNVAPWVDNQYPLETLQVSLNDMNWKTEDGAPNYGYDSGDYDQKILSWSIMAGVLVLDAAIEAGTFTLGTGVALFVTGATYSLVHQHIERTGLWPEH